MSTSTIQQNSLPEQMLDPLARLKTRKMKDDVSARLEEEFGDTFRRGLPGSHFHAGLLLDETITDNLQRILGIVIKTAEYPIVQRGNSLFQVLQIGLDDQQRECDIVILVWPDTPNPGDYWTILKRDEDGYECLNIANRYFGGIEHTVPPLLWPFTSSIRESLDKIKGMFNQVKQATGNDGHTSRIQNTTAKLENSLMISCDTLLRFLQEKCSYDANRMKISRDPYRNVNPDMYIELQYGGKKFIFHMEPSLGRGSIIETNGEIDMVKVSHFARNEEKRELYFSFDSPRWTFFLAEVSPTNDRIAWATKKIPKMMILLHRSIVPESWWNEDSEKLEAWFDTKYLVDMSKDVVAQMEEIFSGFDEKQLGLPPLEDLAKLSQAQLDVIVRARFT